MSHRRIELPQPAIGVAEIVLNISIAVIAQPCQRKCLDGTVPVASDDRSLAGSEIRIERSPIRVLYHRSHRRADRPGFHRDCRLSYSALCAWWRRSQILSSGGGQKVKRPLRLPPMFMGKEAHPRKGRLSTRSPLSNSYHRETGPSLGFGSQFRS